MMYMTKNFTLNEFVRSETAQRLGIENKPNSTHISSMKYLCERVLQPLRSAIGRPVIITSGFRSAPLNRAIKGAVNSQHMLGEAADFKSTDMAADFEWIRQNCDFDQLIWEYGNNRQPQWIHVSCKRVGNRKEVLKATKSGYQRI